MRTCSRAIRRLARLQCDVLLDTVTLHDRDADAEHGHAEVRHGHAEQAARTLTARCAALDGLVQGDSITQNAAVRPTDAIRWKPP